MSKKNASFKVLTFLRREKSLDLARRDKVSNNMFPEGHFFLLSLWLSDFVARGLVFLQYSYLCFLFLHRIRDMSKDAIGLELLPC